MPFLAGGYNQQHLGVVRLAVNELYPKVTLPNALTNYSYFTECLNQSQLHYWMPLPIIFCFFKLIMESNEN